MCTLLGLDSARVPLEASAAYAVVKVVIQTTCEHVATVDTVAKKAREDTIERTAATVEADVAAALAEAVCIAVANVTATITKDIEARLETTSANGHQ